MARKGSRIKKGGPAFAEDSVSESRVTESLEAAQEIMWDAWENDDPRQRRALAKKALKLSPLCADAYVVLASMARSVDEGLALYRQGVEAGEKALGEAMFREYAGDFWGILETRPYMRARQGLAQALWIDGSRDEAVAHLNDMLRLNPNDNQGIRYLLMDCLLELGRDDQAAEVMKRYESDEDAAWAWSEALLSFRRQGDCPDSRKRLATAVETNPHVPAYLLGQRKIPRTLPEFISPGDEDEAIAYADNAAGAWAAAAGALAWLDSLLPDAAPTRSPTPPQKSGANSSSEIDTDRIDDAVLALLSLGLHDHGRVWKTFDWNALDRLHKRGFISNPVGKAKSVMLTDKGLVRSAQAFRDLFLKR